MNFLIFTTFISLFSMDYLANNLKLIPQKMFLFPEAMAVAAMLIVIIVGFSRKRFNMAPKYAIFLIWFILSIACGLIINGVDSLVAISGVRIYLKSLPFFLLPFVYQFSEKQIKHQLYLLLILCLVQLPISAYQRFVQYAGVGTGDVVGGSLGVNTSGVLSILLMFAIALLTAMAIKGRIKTILAIPLIFLLFLPTTFNETKVVLLLFPFVLLSPVFFGPDVKNRIRKLILLSVVGTFFLVGFVAVYDVIQDNKGGSLVEKIQSGAMFSYMYKDDKLGKFSQYEVGRFDAIVYATKKIHDTGNSIFGVGIGNASPSNSKKLVGEYYTKWYWMVPEKVMLSRIIWEMGYVGVILFITLLTFVFFDARYLSKKAGWIGSFALGWVPIVLIVGGSFTYFSIFVTALLSHLFFFYSGYIASTRYVFDRDKHLESDHFKRTDPKRFANKINPRLSRPIKARSMGI